MTAASTRWQVRVTLLLAILILIPSGYGFIGKFVELIRLARGQPDGAFAVAPVANYLLASLGFFCLLLWATMHGMFRNIEQPKYDMLQREAQLDGADGMWNPSVPSAGRPPSPPAVTRDAGPAGMV